MRQQLIDYTWEDGYQPFDKDYALKLYEVLIDEGYDAVEGMSEEELIDLFGIGWWKHDEEKAEELMVKSGCERDSEGFWTYNGERLAFEIICPSGFEAQSERLSYACASQWYEFGFDATVQASEASLYNTADDMGTYTVGSYWPACGVMRESVFSAARLAFQILYAFRLCDQRLSRTFPQREAGRDSGQDGATRAQR